jgi:stress-induced-phosphoprotein 1
MTDTVKVAETKAKGNAAFKAQNYEEAIRHFTEAIKLDSSDHVFFSNRSACYASLNKYDEALKDGTECVRLKPDWAKGYTRKGLAEFFLKKYDDATETYKAGLKLAPDDPALKEGLQKAMGAKSEVPGFGAGGGGGLFGKMDPSALASAAAKNPKIAEYMQDKQLMQKINMIMQLGGNNQQMQQQLLMQMMQQDPRVLEVFMAMQGMDVSTMRPEDMGAGDESAPSRAAPTKEKKSEQQQPEDVRTPEQKEADDFKTKGNELYKKKQFNEALEMYAKAIEKEPNDLTYYNNRCAVWIEMGEEKYDTVLESCKDVIQRRYEINSANPGGASFEKVAKVFARMAVVYEKRKQFDDAIEMYNKALTEDNNRSFRNALRELTRAKEKFEKDSYIDPAKAEEHREKGNEFFKQQNWADAKREYDEAVMRNPSDAKLYSNRAAALTKLLAYPDALRDLDECLKLDPKFIKAYSRKAAAHFFMKEYNQALKAYENGLKIDAANEECLRGREQVIAKVSEVNRSGHVDEEQMRHAMADPEIQQILHDPQVKIFLKTMQENPKDANKQLQTDTKMQEAVSKLMAAGIIRTG